MRVAVLTFGCRVNQAESLAIERAVRARGAQIVSPGQADVVIVNSCSVTATADQGTRQSVRRIARENPSAQIVVTGCYATRSPEEVAALPGVVQVVPNARKDALPAEIRKQYVGQGFSPANPSYVGQGFSPANPSYAEQGFSPATQPCNPPPPAPGAGARTAFTLRVQNGCEEPCSYCIIPSTRGASRSTPPDALVRELQRIEDAGFKELTLTGVHLGAYGRDLDEPCPLHALLERALDGTRSLVLRLGSLEPMDCTPALIGLAASTERLAKTFHLPLQHASDRVLARMRRPYTCAEYHGIVTAVRRAMPQASITADVIVGFPGETDADFEALTTYLAASPLTQLHVFPYSERPGTAAASLQPKVHGTVIRARAAAVRAVGQGLQAGFYASQVGRVLRALTIEDGRRAVTTNGLKVQIRPGFARNEWVAVRMEGDGTGTVDPPPVGPPEGAPSACRSA